MFPHSMQITSKFSSPPLTNNTSPSDSEGEIILELEAKRKQLDEEIEKFRLQKHKEFRDFETELRSKRMQKNTGSTSRKREQLTNGVPNKPKRTSSSSALDLLVGHGPSKNRQTNSVFSRKNAQKSPAEKDLVASKTLPSQPTLSLDPLNVKGETVSQTHPHTPPTPTLVSRSPPKQATDTSLSEVPKQEKSSASTSKVSHSSARTHEQYDSFAGLFTPTYLPLLDAKPNPQLSLDSALITPPLEASNNINIQNPLQTLPDGVISLQSSSFPPRITLSLNSHSKRAYTAPTSRSIRMPSALRTSSAGSISRKGKRVTFRLADSAIVEPSSSYEEGPSPQINEPSNSALVASGTRSPLKNSRPSLSGSRKSSDEEDEKAGVKPGMNMGEVIQKLNNYSMPSGDDDEINVEYQDDEDEEDVAYIDTKYHEDEEDDNDKPNIDDDDQDNEEEEEDDDDDDDLQMNVTPSKNPIQTTEAEEEEDGYFSPHAKHASPNQKLTAQELQQQRRNSSPLSPYRDANWDQLSSSDKDRLLFKGRGSEEEDNDFQDRRKNSTNRTSSRSGNQASKEKRGSRHTSTPESPTSISNVQFEHAIDGGSGVGFFELDEELASPDAGVAKPFDFPDGADSTDDIRNLVPCTHAQDSIANMHDSIATIEGSSPPQGQNPIRSNDSEKTMPESKAWNTAFSEINATVGSVPIAIVRPSMSISSSWIGTFGH